MKKVIKMKKVIIASIVAILLICILLIYNNSKSMIQKVTNTNKIQSEYIEKVLADELSFECKSIEKFDLNNSLLENVDDDYAFYKISDKNERDYMLILKKDNKDVIGVLDENNKLVFGLIDNSVLPKYFN